MHCCSAYFKALFFWDALPGFLWWMCLVTKLNLFFGLPYTHRIIYCSIPHHFSCLFMAHVLLTFTLMLLPLSNAFCLETIDLTAPKVWVCLCFTAGRALGWQQLMPVLGQREKKKEEGAREHQLWSDYPSGVVPRPSPHTNSPFKKQNKYNGGDKLQGPPP